MPRFTPKAICQRTVLVVLVVVLLAPTSGCVSALHHRASHLCRCVCFRCDDYCPKRVPDVCTPARGTCCDNYCRKCSPSACSPCRQQTCDNYCPKPTPDVCWCPPLDPASCH